MQGSMQEYIDASVKGFDGLAAMHRKETRHMSWSNMIQHRPTLGFCSMDFYGMSIDSPSFLAFSSRSNLAERL